MNGYRSHIILKLKVYVIEVLFSVPARKDQVDAVFEK
jgi:hypothetical protein